MSSCNPHGIFQLVKHDTYSSSMINGFTICIVFQIISGIIASIAINILNIQVAGWRCVQIFGKAIVLRSHVLNCLYPARSTSCLITFGFFHNKIISFSNLLILWFFDKLLRSFLDKSKRLHPHSTMIIIGQHRFELIKSDLLVIIVIILLELLSSNFMVILLCNFIQEF